MQREYQNSAYGAINEMSIMERDFETFLDHQSPIFKRDEDH